MSGQLKTPFDIAHNLVGLQEMPGNETHPFIAWCHSLCPADSNSDEIPWCSSFVNGICELYGLPRTRSRLARSWMHAGAEVSGLDQARIGWDILVLRRGEDWQGHVGFFAGWYPTQGTISLLAGNQHDQVSIASFPVEAVLAIRRLG